MRGFSQPELDNWPQWRGPTWNGVAPLADPPIQWGEDSENLAWKTPLPGAGNSTPILWGNRIFIHTAIPLETKLPVPDLIPEGTPNIRPHPDVEPTWRAQRIAIHCYDRRNGELLWDRTVFEGMPHQGHHWKGGFASESPATDGERLYSYFGSFGLFCHSMDGELVWQKSFGALAIEDSLGEGTSPALWKEDLVIVVDHELQSFIVCLDKHSGDEKWRTDRGEVSNWSTPHIFTHEGRDQVVVNGAPVCCYDMDSGELLWSCAGQSLSAVPMPAVGRGLAFAASGWRKDTVHAIRLGQRGDLTKTDHLVWSLDRGAPYVPSPTVWGDEIYLLEDRSFFSCLNAIDGTPHYFKERMPGVLNFSASPTGAKDRIYLLSEDGKSVVLKRGPELEILAENELEGAFFASPAIAGDSIFLRSHQALYRFDRSAASN